MQQSDRVKFASLMGELCVAFRVIPTEELLEVYWKHLEPVNINVFQGMVNHNIKNCDRFPTISQLLREPEYQPPEESVAIKEARRKKLEKYI